MLVSTSTVNDIASSTASVLAGSLPLIVILFGIGIAFFVLRNVSSLLPKG